ncbi:glycosyltransferase [Anaerocolumna sedimenticola]|uniref:Glycosyltransferase n=1 Tax=Anaerocolumna sedimenticola TaxID=2696063 RepID=A0A6P1THT4_9FIRM|nr:glycosyltransferase [Anaerocolumna sedimenticola]QHQ60704.1 glycosyltransferase [Anaerocolumna sedimenticola]
MKKILILKGISQYNVLRYAADAIASGFKDLGCQVKVIGFHAADDFDVALREIMGEYDLIFSFQALFFDYKLEDNTFLYNNISTPVFGYIVDHPSYHHERLSAELNSNVYLGCIDNKHVSYIRRYYPGIKNVFYIPHAGFESKERIPFEKKDIDLFFPGTYTPSLSYVEAINQLPDIFCKTAYKIIEYMQNDLTVTLEGALEVYFNSIGFNCSIDEFRELMVMLLPVDGYIRSFYRDLCIHTLLENGIHVTVAGNGWREFITSYSENLNVISDKGIDIENVIELIGRSKIVLNVIPTYKEGLHERLITGMHCNAVSLTHSSTSIEKFFKNKENIVIFDLNNTDQLPYIVNDLLTDVNKSKEIAIKGCSIAAGNHKWSDRARDILNICCNI